MNDTPSDFRLDRPSGLVGFRADPQPSRAGLAPRPVPLRAVGLLLLLLFIAAVVWIVHNRSQPPAQTRRFAGATVPVAVAPVTRGDLPVELSALGTVTPLATVTVKTQISGQLVAVGFSEGQLVKKGDFLAQIDPRPYQVALEQAEGQLGKDEAALNNAKVDLKRYDTLVAQNSIARQTRDTQAALVVQGAATVKADQAQIDAQKLNLVYCHIISPVGGRVGLRQVDPGNYVTPGDATGIVVVTQLQPISVIFTLPEDQLPQVMQRLHAGAGLSATAYDRSGATKLAQGKLETVDNQIDPTTGTVKLRAIFANSEETLFSNQFVNIRLLVNTLQGVELVPAAAIQRGAPGTFVYVVGTDSKVSIAKVALGAGNSQVVAITKGVQDGQQVVVDGADRLKVGATVSVVPPAGAAGSGAASAPAQPKGQRQRKKSAQ